MKNTFGTLSGVGLYVTVQVGAGIDRALGVALRRQLWQS